MPQAPILRRIAEKALAIVTSREDRLAWAAMSGDAVKIEALVMDGANIDYRAASKMPTSSQGTALHHASHGGHVDAVNTLLRLGADPNISNALGYTPLAAWFSFASRQVRRDQLKTPEDLPENFLQCGVALLAAGAHWNNHHELRRDIFMDEPQYMQHLDGYIQARMEQEMLARDVGTSPAPSAKRMRL